MCENCYNGFTSSFIVDNLQSFFKEVTNLCSLFEKVKPLHFLKCTLSTFVLPNNSNNNNKLQCVFQWYEFGAGLSVYLTNESQV